MIYPNFLKEKKDNIKLRNNFIWNWGRFLKYNNYIDGGIVEEVKENILIHNKSFKGIINLPDICE